MPKVIFRPQRSSLDDAMKEASEFDGFEAMKDWIVDDHNRNGVGHPIESKDVTVGPDEINDDRIGWKDTRYVLVKDFGVAGMCATQWS